MKLIVFFLFFFVTFVCSTSLERKKRSVMTMAGGFPFGGFGGAGAFAGAGFPMVPMFNPFGFSSRGFVPMPFVPFPMPTAPWYEGDNVCTTTKQIEDPKELQEWFADAATPNVDYNHVSEQCQGTGSKYVCFKRYISNGVSKMQVTKYECCHGFVRNGGSGCTESAQAEQALNGRNQQNTYYFYPLQTSTSSSSSSKGGSVEGVPIQ